MQIDKAKCKAYWAGFVASLPDGDPRTLARPDAFGFGGEGEIADELAALVLAGRKRATASLPVEYSSIGEALPKSGDLSIILDGTGNPVAIIERTSVEVVPFQDVTAEFAAIEGEGDGSLGYWREAHASYFGQVCERLGGMLQATTPVLCQRFKVVWPRASQALDAGPFFHGTRADLKIGDLLTAGFRSNYRPSVVMNHIYFTSIPKGAGLAAEMAQGHGRPRVYVVEPLGDFENDPNVTDKKFPGNPTRSYRSAQPLRIVGELEQWEAHDAEFVEALRMRVAAGMGEIIN